MRHFIYCFAAVFLAGQVHAESCPPPPDHADALNGLISQVQAAKSEAEARPFGAQMWELWAQAPNEQAQAMLDRGILRLRSADFLGAIQDLTELTEYCPDFAEGYNQRAFANYLQQNFAAALVDLDRAIALSPNHIAALSGRALTLLGLGRTDDARAALAKALDLNPWLSERGLAAPGGPLAPLGKDI